MEIRVGKGFTQKDIAEKVGISQQHYQHIESGKIRSPNKINIEKKIAETLGFDWTRFFDEE